MPDSTNFFPTASSSSGLTTSLNHSSVANTELTTTPRNVVIFVADGLRSGSVNPIDAPTLYNLRNEGVNFSNSHGLFPTLPHRMRRRSPQGIIWATPEILATRSTLGFQ